MALATDFMSGVAQEAALRPEFLIKACGKLVFSKKRETVVASISFRVQSVVVHYGPRPNCVSEPLASSPSWLSPVGLVLPVAVTHGSPRPQQLCSSRQWQLPPHPAVCTDI